MTPVSGAAGGLAAAPPRRLAALRARSSGHALLAARPDQHRQRRASSTRPGPSGCGPKAARGILGGTVPIVIDGIMYLPLGNAVVALEADTAASELWRHTPDRAATRPPFGQLLAGRRHAQAAHLLFDRRTRWSRSQAATGQIDTAFGDQRDRSKIEGTPYQYPPSVSTRTCW